MDGMQAYLNRCCRAVVVDRNEPTTSRSDEPSQEGPVVSDGTDTRHVAHRLPLTA
jgi:hypothetical protein